MLSIQPKDSSGGSGETRETIVYRMAEEMLGKLPHDYIPWDVSIIQKDLKTSISENKLSSYFKLAQNMYRTKIS